MVSSRAIANPFWRSYKVPTATPVVLKDFRTSLVRSLSACPQSSRAQKRQTLKSSLIRAISQSQDGVPRDQLQSEIEKILAGESGTCGPQTCSNASGLPKEEVGTFLDQTLNEVKSEKAAPAASMLTETKQESKRGGGLYNLIVGSLKDDLVLQSPLFAIEKVTGRKDLKDMTTVEALKKLSKENLDYTRTKVLRKLSPEENDLVEKTKFIRPYYTHTTTFEAFKSISQSSGLLSPKKMTPDQKKFIGSAHIKVNEDMIGASSYVFVAVGQYEGLPLFGDVVFRIKTDVQELEKLNVIAWSNIEAPYSWANYGRAKSSATIKVTDQDKAGYARRLIMPEHEGEYLSYWLIDFSRQRLDLGGLFATHEENLAEIKKALADESDPEKKRRIYHKNLNEMRLKDASLRNIGQGTLESHFYHSIPWQAIEQVDVPTKYRPEVEKMDLRPEIKNLIKFVEPQPAPTE